MVRLKSSVIILVIEYELLDTNISSILITNEYLFLKFKMLTS